MQIGNVSVRHPVVLAPMAGVTDLPFRRICERFGAGLVCTEMVSAKAILYNNKNNGLIMETAPDEHPIALQLFGSDPFIVSAMANRVKDKFDIIDINMGCPVPKIVNNGEGSALMKTPELAYRILETLVRTVDRPITVKFRKGFSDKQVNAVEFARAAEAAGVSAVTVHGRTREQYYHGKADWDIIRQVKAAVRIPVIGNGDIFEPKDAKRMMEETGVDAVAVARGVQGNPWLIQRTVHYLETGELLPEPGLEEVKAVIREHAAMMTEAKGEYTGVREMRKHIAWYTSGIPNSARLRGEINTVESMDMLLELVDKL